MAESTIDSVTTFVAELPPPSLEEVLEKFQGRRTPRALAAARRICAKKRTVKVPRNLLRQLWRVTGGWKEGSMKVGWDEEPDERWTSLRLGDLLVVFSPRTDDRRVAMISYRGFRVARIDQGYSSWLNYKKVNGAVEALSAPYVVQPKK